MYYLHTLGPRPIFAVHHYSIAIAYVYSTGLYVTCTIPGFKTLLTEPDLLGPKYNNYRFFCCALIRKVC